MTTDEKNRRLAELLGWEEITYPENRPSMNRPVGSWGRGRPPGGSYYKREWIADFCNDLNAVHFVEISLEGDLKCKYRQTLANVLTECGCHPNNSLLFAIHATAEQRTDALIKTLENR